MSLLLLVIIAAVLGGGYYAWSLWRRPWRPCPRCHGRGNRDRVFRYASGACARCENQGRLPRGGVRVFTPGRAKAMTAAKGTHRKADHRGNP